MLNLSRPWSPLGPVDPTAAIAWLSGGASWLPTASPTKPTRCFDLPPEIFTPLVASVLAFFGDDAAAAQTMLSRMLPGQSHPLHVDSRRADGLCRVHVPLTTNPGAWLLFEGWGYCDHCFGTRENRDDWTVRDGVTHYAPCAWCQGTGWIEGVEAVPFHLAVGTAYTFDTTKRHAFGNDGTTERVHLLVDVVRRD